MLGLIIQCDIVGEIFSAWFLIMKYMSLMVCGVLLMAGGSLRSLGATESTSPLMVSVPDFLIPLGGQSGSLDVYYDGRPAETSGFDVLGSQRVVIRPNSVSAGMVTLNLHLPGFLLNEPGSLIESASLKFTVRDLDFFPDLIAPGVTLRETASVTAVNGVALVNPLKFADYLPTGTRVTDNKEIALNSILISQINAPGVNFAEPFVLTFTFEATVTSGGSTRPFEIVNAPESIAPNIRLEVGPGPPGPPPVPEPTTLALLGLGAAMVAWRIARRQKV